MNEKLLDRWLSYGALLSKRLPCMQTGQHQHSFMGIGLNNGRREASRQNATFSSGDQGVDTAAKAPDGIWG